jgi:hypothetical protein
LAFGNDKLKECESPTSFVSFLPQTSQFLILSHLFKALSVILSHSTSCSGMQKHPFPITFSFFPQYQQVLTAFLPAESLLFNGEKPTFDCLFIAFPSIFLPTIFSSPR